MYRTEADNRLLVDNIYRKNVNGVSRWDFPFIAPWVLDPNNDRTVYLAARYSIYRNTAIDDEFARDLWGQIADSRPSNGSVTALAVSNTPANKLFVGSSSGRLARFDDAKDADNPPVRIDGNGLGSGHISCIALDPDNADVMMVVFSNYNVRSLFHTTNGGAEWTDVSGNLEQNPDGSGAGPSCRWANLVKVDGQTIWFVGTSTGLYSTTVLNGGSTVWRQEGASVIGNSIVTMIKTREIDGYVAIGTHGNGIFTTNAVAVSAAGLPEIPAEFYLEQHYPNPVSGSTTLKFRVPDAAQFTLNVHDALGRIVKEIHSGSHAPGIHRMQLQVNDLPVGNYFLRMSSGDFAQTRMLTVTR